MVMTDALVSTYRNTGLASRLNQAIAQPTRYRPWPRFRHPCRNVRFFGSAGLVYIGERQSVGTRRTSGKNNNTSIMPELAADCPFCTLPSSRIIREDSLCWVIRDGYPVSPGHSLIIPKRHMASWFDLTEEESASLLRQLSEAKTVLNAEFKPDGYNIGINEGAAGGQTVFHLHVHLIPRYHGDMTDPRGGVRWIFPDKASYWI